MGARRLLTINTGSSSLKAALYRLREDTTETLELRVEASTIGSGGDGMRFADDRGEILDERRDDLSAARSGARRGRPGSPARSFATPTSWIAATSWTTLARCQRLYIA